MGWPALGVCLPSQDGRVGFVLRARRPPASPPAAGPVAEVGLCGDPRAPIPPAVAGALGVPCRPRGCGRTRPERDGLRTRAPDSPRSRCRRIAPTPPTSRSRAQGRVGPPLRQLAFAPHRSDPDRPFSRSSTPVTIFTAIVLVVLV